MSIKETALSRRFDWQMDCPNWQTFIEMCADYFADYLAAIMYLQTSTWRDSAQGVWVDRIGEIVGVTRPAEEEVDNIFTVCEVGETDPDDLHCWGEVGEPSMGGFVWDLNGIIDEDQATDETYLEFIAAKIAATNADASIPGIAKFIQNAFGLDCTVTAIVGRVSVEIVDDPAYDLRTMRFLKYFVPIVAGVDFVILNWPEV